MGFLDKKKNEEWIDGTPESFKIWFWVRLAISLFVMYSGGELVWKWIQGEVPWYAMATGAALVTIGIVFLILDVRRYLRLRKALKERDADDSDRTADKSALGTRPSLSRSLASDVSGSPEGSDNVDDGDHVIDQDGGFNKTKPSSISGFARYVVKDEEGDSDDEV